MQQTIQLISREMTSAEFQRMKMGFDEHTLEKNVKIQSADRFGFVASYQEQFVGCSSGLAYKNDQAYSGWFYLTDLFVEKAYRGQNIGANLLKSLENQVFDLGIRHIWTWTAGYEAAPFYQKQGYDLFAKMENWFSDGSSRIGLKKALSSNQSKKLDKTN